MGGTLNIKTFVGFLKPLSDIFRWNFEASIDVSSIFNLVISDFVPGTSVGNLNILSNFNFIARLFQIKGKKRKDKIVQRQKIF